MQSTSWRVIGAHKLRNTYIYELNKIENNYTYQQYKNWLMFGESAEFVEIYHGLRRRVIKETKRSYTGVFIAQYGEANIEMGLRCRFPFFFVD